MAPEEEISTPVRIETVTITKPRIRLVFMPRVTAVLSPREIRLNLSEITVYKRVTMIELNTMALTYFMHLYVNEWKGKQGGKILNIASTAAFQPGPMMAVYFATKSYVLQLSEALNHELGEEGTSVTVLCPGPTSTYFGEESGMSASRLVKNVKIARASDVARLGYDAMMKGKPVAIHGAMNKIAPFAIRFFPRKWVTHLSARVMRLPKKR